MAFTGVISADKLGPESKFRLKVVNWKKYQAENVSQFLKLIPAGTADTMRYETVFVRGLFYEILRYAASSRQDHIGWIVDGDGQPVTLESITDILRLKEEDKPHLLPGLRRLIITKRIMLTDSIAESDVETLSDLPKPSKTLPNLEKPSEINTIDEMRLDKKRLEKINAPGTPDCKQNVDNSGEGEKGKKGEKDSARGAQAFRDSSRDTRLFIERAWQWHVQYAKVKGTSYDEKSIKGKLKTRVKQIGLRRAVQIYENNALGPIPDVHTFWKVLNKEGEESKG